MIDVGEGEYDYKKFDLALGHVVVVLERDELFVFDVEDERKRENDRDGRVEIEIALEIEVLDIPDDAPHEDD